MIEELKRQLDKKTDEFMATNTHSRSKRTRLFWEMQQLVKQIKKEKQIQEESIS